MAGLTSKSISSSYKSLLRVDDDTYGVDTTVESITDGEGTSTPIRVSTTQVVVGDGTPVAGKPFTVMSDMEIYNDDTSQNGSDLYIYDNDQSTYPARFLDVFAQEGDGFLKTGYEGTSGNSYADAMNLEIAAGYFGRVAGGNSATTGDAYDEANFFIDGGTGLFGIGTNAPEGKLSIGSGKHVIAVDQPVRFADNGDNSVCVELSNVKIPAKAIIIRVAAVVKVLSSASTHEVNIQMSATSGTAAHAAISSGTELLGAGVTNTDSTDATSASAISLGTSADDLKDVWICNDVVRNGTSDQYLYVCNDGTGNANETTPTLAVLTVIVEYYGMD